MKLNYEKTANTKGLIIRKNIYPSQAQEIVDEGYVGIVLLEDEPSQKTMDIFTNANITVYAGLDPERVREILKKLTTIGRD